MKRVSELDGLRGLAALAVIVYHRDPHVAPFGWMAVELFFVLSGFLITGIILREGDNPGFFRAFYGRRALRIFPPYYLAVFLVAVVSGPTPWKTVAGYLTYTQFYGAWWGNGWKDLPGMGHTWSLAVEEQFYLLWPALVLLIGRRRLVPGALAIAAGSALSRQFVTSSHLLHTRCDALALGALLAALTERSPDDRRTARGVAAVASVAAAVVLAVLVASGHRPVIRWRMDHLHAEREFAALASLAVVSGCLAARGHRATGWLRSAPLVYLGVISYGLYLYHMPVMDVFAAGLPGVGRLGVKARFALVDFPLTFGLAALSWHAFERPILSLKRFFEYHPEPPRGAESPGLEPLQEAVGA